MKTISALRAVYGVAKGQWSMVLELEDKDEKRFDVHGPDHVEAMIEAFDDATSAAYDAETDEVVFSFEYAALDFEGEEEEDEDDREDEDDEEDEEDEDEDEESEDDAAKTDDKSSKGKKDRPS